MDIIEQIVEQFERASQKKYLNKARKNYDKYDSWHKKTRTSFDDHLYYMVRTEIARWASYEDRFKETK